MSVPLSCPSAPRESPDEDRSPVLVADAPPAQSWPRPPAQIRDEQGRTNARRGESPRRALAGCLENRVSVELFTQIHGDGTCTRRVEYRLERVDTNKGDARVEIRPEDDVLVRWHRFPSGEPWQVREERETGLHVIVLEALLPSPAAADGDFFRARAPRAQPARNVVSAFVDAEHGLYEYQEVLRDPSSPLAAARALSRAALKRDGAFAEGFAEALAGKGAGPRESDVRRAFRERLAEPFAREVALLAERPLYGPRERRDLDLLFDRIDEKQKDLAARLSALAPGTPPEEIEAAAEASFNALGDEPARAARGGRAPAPHARGRGTASASAPPSSCPLPSCAPTPA